MSTMRNDLSSSALSKRVAYRVIPCEPGHSCEPVVLTADTKTVSPFRMQDYFTADQADELAAALTAGAKRARELAQ
jgi:hypothetical protein